jgi:hypothetical protein
MTYLALVVSHHLLPSAHKSKIHNVDVIQQKTVSDLLSGFGHTLQSTCDVCGKAQVWEPHLHITEYFEKGKRLLLTVLLSFYVAQTKQLFWFAAHT